MSSPEHHPLARVTSIKVKLGLLVGVSVLVATVLATTSSQGGLAPWLAIPVTVLIALGVTQLLAVGMTAPLRQMTEAAARMARGDYTVRVHTDATDEVGHLARAFNTMAADLAEVDERRRGLVTTVSHELRTPLAGLVAVLENVEDGVVAPDPATIRSALGQAERLEELVRDLLDLSRYDAGVVRLDPVDVAVADLVATAVAETDALNRTLGRDVRHEVRVTPGDLVVRGEPGRLHQLLANLLDNASRHATPGGTVRVSVDRVGTTWRLGVANPGAAVAPGDRERAFERFGRLGAALDDRGGGGTGLGLAIVRWVAELHEGRVGFVDPPDGEGALVVADLALDPRPPTRGAPMPTPPTAPAAPAPVPLAAPPAPPVVADLIGWWPSPKHPGSIRLLLAAAAVGLLAALLVVGELPGLGYAATLLAGGATVWGATGWRRDAFTLACGGLAVLLVLVLVLRDAQWIGALCVLAASVLCLVGSTRARSVLGLVRTGLAAAVAGIHGLPWLGRSLRLATRAEHGLAVARTVLLSLVAVVTFGLLFASADALFSSWVGAVLPDVHLGDELVARIFVGLFVAALVLATAYLALTPPTVEPATPAGRRPVRRRYEWLVPVLLVDAVFVLFLAAQATATFGGHAYLHRTTGLTYADYVHQGFGQLIAATVLTLLVVALAGRKAAVASPADRAWLRGALGLLALLALVVVASALHRLDLYQQAYGLTRLRLLVAAFEVWLGVLVVAVLAAGVRLRGAWLPRLGLLSGAATLLVLALLNPDAMIAERNLAVYDETGRIDEGYLLGLSSDATEALALRRLVPCGALSERAGPREHWTEWNWGRVRSRAYLATHPVGTQKVLCGVSRP